MEEENFSPEQSLQIIQSMISKAKCDFEETGVSALLWGSIITFCALITFGNYWWHQDWLNYVWVLTIAAVAPQIIISIRESKRKKFKSRDGVAISGVWISFGIAIFLFSYFTNVYNVPHVESALLILYGIPTFTTGMMTNFKAMIYGGIICWIIALISMYVAAPYTMLLTAAAATIAWFIPGLILRKRYLQIKKENV
jgi:hypothetical protein